MMKRSPRVKMFFERETEVDTEGSWILSYGDMITLLLMFFVLFFSVDKQADRFKALEAALLKQLAPKESSKSGTPYNFSLGDKKGEAISETLMAKWGAQVGKVGSKIFIEFPEVSFYAFGDVKVSAAGVGKLVEFASYYMPYAGDYLLTIRSFTDTVPVDANGSKRFKDNLELSALRSIAAMRYLQKAGIPLKRMRAEGYGELRLTDEEKAISMAAAKSAGLKGIPLARRLVLIVEPEVEDRL